MTSDLGTLRSAQLPGGAFRSVILFGTRQEDDANGFVTALVLRALRLREAGRAREDLAAIRNRALAFLEGCASPHAPGVFGFWPPDERPRWAASVPGDLDDTAVLTLELAVHGRRSRAAARASVLEAIVPFAIARAPRPGPPWIHAGAFPTWITADASRANPVDACVNANIAALMAFAQVRDAPGYAEACATVADAVAWAGDDPRRLRAITPYYPHPRELLAAIEHAVACGAVELATVLPALVETCRGIVLPDPLAHAVCSNAYGPPYWRSTVLEHVRRVTPHAGDCARRAADPPRRGSGSASRPRRER